MSDNRTVYFSSFKGGSTIAAFRKAFEYLRKNPGVDLCIEPGEYILSDEMSLLSQNNVMTGKYGSNPQKVMFNPEYQYTVGVPISGLKDCTIWAENVRLVIDGFMEPVSVKDCSNVSIKGFEITHKRKPFSRGTIIEMTENGCMVEFDKDCTVHRKTPLLLRHFFCDSETNVKQPRNINSVKFIDSNHIELISEDLENINVGMLFYTVHTYHSRPAMLIENSENIRVEGLVIRNQPGMGIVGNRCENVWISGLKVIPEPGYHLSTNTDATHFTSIKGYLKLTDCIADSQGDDFTNVHTYYQDIKGENGERTYRICENTPDGTHSQSIDYPDVGDILELTEISTLETLGEYKVEDVKINVKRHCCTVTLDRCLPENTKGLVLSDITRLPKLEIRGCVSGNHYARGVLIKCRSAIISNNTFHGIMGPAIEVAAEAHWYEGVNPANVIIENNRIENCSTEWGEAAGVVVKADCSDPKYKCIKNIVIRNNQISSPGSKHGIYCRNVDGLTVENNEIDTSGEPVVCE